MKVLVVTSGINPAAGGPTRSCKGMCRALSQAGVDVALLVIHGRHPFENPTGVKVLYAEDEVEVGGSGLQRMVSDFDLVHVQGLWNPKLHKVVKACRKAKVPYVISPRGMLDPWALSVKKWKKRLGMLLYQRSDLKHAAAFHATAELEAANIRAQGLKQPIFIAPNGVEVPVNAEQFRSSTFHSNSENRTAIFLSRLHPGKGLLTLAEAWARVKPQGWVLRIVGPDSYGHKAEVLAKLDVLGITHADVPARTHSNIRTFEHSNNSSWQFVDMVDDIVKWQEYAAAAILVHPSVSENFGITIAEGLAAGLPVICTDGTPWTEIADRKCGWYIKANSVDDLAVALREATNSAELTEMGARGRKLVEEHYTWAAVCDKIMHGYEGVLK